VRQAAPHPPGNYLDYYANLRDHLCGRAELMVTPDQVLQVMQMLTMGQERAQLGDAVVCGLQNTQPGDQAADKGVTPRMRGISV
jgi:hypothetical protein